MPEVVYRGRRGPSSVQVFRETHSQGGGQTGEELLFPPPDHLWEGDLTTKPTRESLGAAHIFDWGPAAPDIKVTNLTRAILWNHKRDGDFVAKCERALGGFLRNAPPEGFAITDSEIDQLCGSSR
jgi:hypothetical protein